MTTSQFVSTGGTVSQRLLGLDEHPVLGWAALPAALTRPDVFERIRRCGINTFITCPGPNGPMKYEMALELDEPSAERDRQVLLATEHGLRAIVSDGRFVPAPEGSEDADWRDQLARAVEEVQALPGAEAIAGFYVFDEPRFESPGSSRAGVAEVAKFVHELRRLAPDKAIYVNANGSGTRGCDCYSDYLDRYVRTLDPQFLSFDWYPIVRARPTAGDPDGAVYPLHDTCDQLPELGAYIMPGYFEACEAVRDTARRHELPIWSFVNAAPHAHSRWFYGPVTEGTLRFEAFTGLAYGAQVTQYFPMRTQVGIAGYGRAILDSDGEESPTYPLFRTVNRDLKVFGGITAALNVVDVCFTGPTPSGGKAFRPGRWAEDSSHKPLAFASGDPVLLSFMKSADDSRRFLWVVNRNPARVARLQLVAWTGWQFRELIRYTGRWDQPHGQRVLCNLEPGDATLYEFLPPGQTAPAN